MHISAHHIYSLGILWCISSTLKITFVLINILQIHHVCVTMHTPGFGHSARFSPYGRKSSRQCVVSISKGVRLSFLRACCNEQEGKIGPEISAMYIPSIQWRWVRLSAMEPSREESDLEPGRSLHGREDYRRLGIGEEDTSSESTDKGWLDGVMTHPVGSQITAKDHNEPTGFRQGTWSTEGGPDTETGQDSKIRFGRRGNWRTGGRDPRTEIPS